MTSSFDSGSSAQQESAASGSARGMEPTSSGSEPVAFSAPLALLTLYGALDLAVIEAIESDDASTAAVIEQYLPGAVENRGWSEQLHRLLLPARQRRTEVPATVADALQGLLNYHKQNAYELTIPDLANLVYVIGALKHIPAANADPRTSDLMAQVLALAAPTEGLSEEERLIRASVFLEEDLTTSFTGFASWPDFITKAAEAEYVMKLVAKVPQCRTSVVTVNGIECVVIDADIESDTVSFADVIAVVDPRNWPRAYPSFFCSMKNFGSRAPLDNWWNIVETAGFCKIKGGYALTQRLRFLKTDQIPGDARLDFDLAENQQGDGCNQKVLVDRGFVNVMCTRADGNRQLGGVRMETRKVAHVVGIDPYAQAFLLCKLGYGWAAVQCFFGPAQGDHKNYVGWKEPPWLQEPKNALEQPGGGAGQATNATQTAGSGASGGKPQVSTKTAKALAGVASYLTTTNLDITKKWLAGQLSFADLASYGQDVAGRLASEPWKWLQDITTDTGSGSSGGSTGGTP